jgi:hypothetical protein
MRDFRGVRSTVPFLALFIFSTSHALAGICEDLETIRAEATASGFKSWRERVSGKSGEMWHSSFRLSGVDNCKIGVRDDANFFICRWHVSSEREADQGRETIVSALAACPLHSGETVTPPKPPKLSDFAGGKQKLQQIVFWRGDDITSSISVSSTVYPPQDGETPDITFILSAIK